MGPMEAVRRRHFFRGFEKMPKIALQCFSHAGISQLVERNLAKVEVASSRLVSRSKSSKGSPGFPFLSRFGAVAKRLCTGLQIRVGRFDSGPRLHMNQQVSPVRGFFVAVFFEGLKDK